MYAANAAFGLSSIDIPFPDKDLTVGGRQLPHPAAEIIRTMVSFFALPALVKDFCKPPVLSYVGLRNLNIPDQAASRCTVGFSIRW